MLLRSYGQVDRLVISTWIGEFDPWPDLKRQLLTKRVEIVEAEPPPEHLKTGNHFLHQMTSLYHGLMAIDSDTWVLKTRPDVVLEYGALDALFRSVEAHEERPPDIFERKVWVPRFECTQPFNICDVIYFGRRNDLLRLCNFSMFPETIIAVGEDRDQAFSGANAGAEIRTFIGPFLMKYDILHEYNRTWYTAGYYLPWRTHVLLHMINSNIYWEYIGLFLYIMRNYFLIGRPYYEEKINLVRTASFDEQGLLLSNSCNHAIHTIDTSFFLKNLNTPRNDAYQSFCNDQQWVEDIFAGRLPDHDKIEAHLMPGLERALVYRNTPERRAAFQEYQQTLVGIMRTHAQAMEKPNG
ncbi:MAG: hypothetical protein ABT940_11850 [Alphaproteobacteria bacterium]